MLTAAQAADILGIKPRTVYQLAQAGILACHRLGVGGGAVRFAAEDVEAYRAACRSAGTSATNAGATNLTAASAAFAIATQSYCRPDGRESKPKPMTARKARPCQRSPKASPRPRYHIDAAVSRYKRERIPELKAGANAAREIESMRDWWTGRWIEDLPTVCVEYAAYQAGALQPATIKNRIAYLRAACRWAWKRHGMADTDPGARVVAPTVRNARDVAISRAQMVALARACRHRGVRALIRILYWSGMRVAEAQRADRQPGAFVLLDTKNGTPRIVPMLPIITSASMVPMPRRSEIDYWWPLARQACGMEHVHLHDLRHAAASAMASAGVDLGTIGAVLGHKSAQTTKRYAHYQTQRLADALATIRRRA